MSWLAGFRNVENGSAAAGRLDRMVHACREVADESLSAEARDGILHAVRNAPSRHDPLRALFTPTRRWALTGVLPLLVGVVLLLTLDDGIQRPAVGEGVPTVRVSKQGDDVLLHIANGGRPHYVSRSTQPDRFERSSTVRVSDGVYTERLRDRADLVFYRID